MSDTENKLKFNMGVKDGLPIGIGYFPVAFAFGVKASILQVPLFISLLISMTNLTSAGQLAGLDIVAVLGSFIEIIITQLVINSRYFLMSLTLSQKVDDSFTVGKRFFFSTFITDEIFAVAVSKRYSVNSRYFAGLVILPYVGWTLGTLFGAVAGNVLPSMITNALGIALYAMFICIIFVPAVKNIRLLSVIILSAGISCLLYYLPLFDFISNGIAIIISALVSSCVIAIIFPLDPEKGKEVFDE